MVAGGFAVAGQRIAEIEAHIGALREGAGIGSEFHWADYRGGDRRAAYEALVRFAFQLVERKHAALHVIIPKFKGYRHKGKPGENRDTSVSRMYYQLCLHRVARYYGQSRAIQIRLDAGNDCRDVCNMRNELCADAFKRYDTKPNCVRSITPVCSSKSGIVQMADVIMGAIAAKRNGVNHAAAPKRELADLVLEVSGHPSWDVSTRSDARFLTVWNHQTKGGGSS